MKKHFKKNLRTLILQKLDIVVYRFVNVFLEDKKKTAKN